MLQLVLLVGVIAMGVDGVCSVRSVVLVVKFSFACPILCVAMHIPMGHCTIVTDGCSSHVSYCLHCFSVCFNGSSVEFVTTDCSGCFLYRL